MHQKRADFVLVLINFHGSFVKVDLTRRADLAALIHVEQWNETSLGAMYWGCSSAGRKKSEQTMNKVQENISIRTV